MKKLVKTVFFVLAQMALIACSSYAADYILKAGIAKVDITPAENLIMGGYDSSCRTEPSDGAAGKIYVRSLVFDDNVSRLVFIEVDVVSLPPEEYDLIRELISKDTGIPFEHILLGCVHNHAAPLYGEENKNSDWYRQFKSHILKSVKDAIADLEPVKIGGGIGTSRIAMNRRKHMEDTLSILTFDENNSSQSYGKFKTDNPVKIREIADVVRLGANPGGSIDDKVMIMRIDRLSGQPKAVFINYACHGTSLGGRNNTIDSEWNGHMLTYIEKEFPGMTGIFCQGAAGDINPRIVGGLDGYKDDLRQTKDLGYEIGKEVAHVFEKIVTDIPVNPEIRILSEDITCPLKYDEVVKNFRNTTIGVPTTIVKMDQFAWVTFPGELFHQIGNRIKSDTHSQFPFLVGYCNGSLGYLPTQQAYSEGGYEPWASHFDPVTEKVLVKGIDKMIISTP